MNHSRLRLSALAAAFLAIPAAQATGLGRIRFVVVDPVTGKPATGFVAVDDASGRRAVLATSAFKLGETPALDSASFGTLPSTEPDTTVITIPLGTSVLLQQQDKLPTKEITIRVTATRLAPNKAPTSTSATVRDKGEIQKFGGGGGNDSKQLTKGQAGVAEDSAGQAHVRGEHSEIAFVVDGVPLPDTLSGRQGSIVVTSTIQTLEMITGGFAPEFGGQTAAVLNISTLPGVKEPRTDYSLTGGSFDMFGGDLTTVGPIGRSASYVFDLSASRTNLNQEPEQPDHQSAHNFGSNRSVFTKLRFAPNSRDALTLTLSNSPDNGEIPNRTGLPASFAVAGQGFGFLGLRNADGTEAGADPNSGLLGAAPIKLQSQQALGQDINSDEINEFATLNYQRKISANQSAQIAFTVLHSGQEITNNNPAIPNILPVDSSIEYNPEVYRNVHHVQLTGNYNIHMDGHQIKFGFLMDAQSGHESYNLQPASQLALDELYALDKRLAPSGGVLTGQKDVNGNPVYLASGLAPTLQVNRTGAYKAAYLQDTWTLGKFTANYGFRGDWFNSNQDLGQPDVEAFELSPRLNMQYRVDKVTDVRLSYNHLFNTPPLAQGAVVGVAIQPEILDQYDAALTHKLASNQSLTLAYYYKKMHNQVDTGLLIPGVENGVYSAVNFQEGAVHGIEVSYDISAPHGVGWDAYLNFSHSAAQPNGLDSTGAPAPDFNDHDQTNIVGGGVAYTWKSGMSVAGTIEYGSGLASSIVPPSTGRTPRTEVDFHFTTGDHFFRGKGGLSFDVQNVFDDRTVINFQSGFSGTRFMEGRHASLTYFGHF